MQQQQTVTKMWNVQTGEELRNQMSDVD